MTRSGTMAEARETLRNIKGHDVVSVGLRDDSLDEWGERGSYLVPRGECHRVI